MNMTPSMACPRPSLTVRESPERIDSYRKDRLRHGQGNPKLLNMPVGVRDCDHDLAHVNAAFLNMGNHV